MTQSPTQTDASLKMVGIRKRFGATLALDGVDLEVTGGEVLALVGENGAGKSTLMKTLAGVHAPDSGQMLLGDEPYTPRSPLDARHRGVAMIYQELSLAPHLNVMENILLGMEPMRGPLMKWREIRQRTEEALRQVGRPDIRPDDIVGRLSIAEQQLVEIGRAVAVGCRVLVLDEPTSSLTQRDIGLLFDLVRRLRRQGLAIIYISHFLEEVKAISDRFTVLRDGKSVGGGRTADVPADRIVSMMVGRDVKDLYPRTPRKPGPVLLELTDVTGRGGKPLSASLQLRAGEVVGIAGLVGAGRTELLQTIFGLRDVSSGRIRVGTFNDRAGPSQRLAQGVGMLSEDRKTEGLALNLSIADNLTLSKMRRIVRPAQQDVDSRRWIKELAVRCRSPWQPIGDLSGGNQQKIAIARLLHHDVDVLLLDEPTRGIDVGAKALIYQVIDRLAAGGKSVLMVSSYLPELLGTCDRIAVMCRGVLGPARPVAETNEHRIMLEATGTHPELDVPHLRPQEQSR